MRDAEKTKAELIRELEELRRRETARSEPRIQRGRIGAALLQSELPILRLFETLAEGVILVQPDGRIVFANPAAERILGVTRSNLLGESYTAPSWELVDPDGNPQPVEQTAGPRAMRERRPVRNEVMGIKRPDGGLNWLSVNAAPLFGPAGEVEGIVGCFADITERREAERELIESEARLRRQLDAFPVPTYTWRRRGGELRLTGYNAAAERFTRGGVAKTVGMTTEAMHGESSEITLDLRRCLDTRSSLQRTTPYTFRFTDDTKMLRVTYVFVPPDEVVVHTVDITEQAAAEEALRQSEARWKAQFKGTPVPVYAWQRSGEDLVLAGYNDAAERITTGAISRHEGVQASELFRGEPEILAELKHCLATRETIRRTMPYTLQSTGQQKILSCTYSFVEPDTVLVHTEDVTEQVRAEEALRASEEKLRSIVESMDDLIFVLDRDRKFVSFHQPRRAATLYASPDEFLGQAVGDVLPPLVADRALRAIDDVESSGEMQQFDYPLEVRGETRWYGANVSPHRDSSGEFDGVTVVARDITKRKRVERKLEAAREHLEERVEERTREIDGLRKQSMQLAAMRERERLARDLHDSVTQTLFSVSLIADALPAVWERDTDEGHLRLRELGRMTRGALAEMRGLLLELRPAGLLDSDLADLLRQLAASVGGRAGLTVAVEIEGEEDLAPDVKIAVYRIAQEALNNVAKHASASRAIVILNRLPGQGLLWVEDDGRGFDPQQVAAESMGLEIMRERAEELGARLMVESHPGAGTRIEVAWYVKPAQND